MTLVGIVVGLGFSIMGIFLRIFSSTRTAYKGLRYFLALFPPFAFGEGIQNMALIDLFSLIELQGSNKYKPLDWKIAGMNLCFLGWETVVYLLAVIALEYALAMPSFQALFTRSRNIEDHTLRDEDVLAEEKRVAAGDTSDSTIVVKGLKKVYTGGKFAVKGVSLAIPNGECFGLLGINGAGKSTTLGMLTGEVVPTYGDASIAGLNLRTEIHKCRRRIGYCPQFDALFDLLTGREHLMLYARVKGIVPADIPGVVKHKIAEMGLTEYADRAAGTYSGGNKRKLSVAMAMIGEPSIVFLDEPSTGMDPVARRFMWDVISDIVTKREKCSLILTTHSMEECEALCTRIGIMVGGVLRCLGSSQRLRSRYGLGYQIELTFVIPDNAEVQKKLVEIATALNLAAAMSGNADPALDKTAVIRAFTSLGKSAWEQRLTADGTGAEIEASIKSNNFILGKQLASWWLLEEIYDGIVNFLSAQFVGYVVRERQQARLRVEVPSLLPNGESRKLSQMFGLMEDSKVTLCISEYSLSQTSLEQIFNQFASQQEEETAVPYH